MGQMLEKDEKKKKKEFEDPWYWIEGQEKEVEDQESSMILDQQPRGDSLESGGSWKRRQ